MSLTASEYISAQPAERHRILTAIHSIIVEQDTTVVPVVELMMGKEMIIYKAGGSMKYALAGVKNYMSLHLLPMYGSATIYEKYKALLPEAAFQKGCINFKDEEEMPADILIQLIAECCANRSVKTKRGIFATEENKGEGKVMERGLVLAGESTVDTCCHKVSWV